MEAKGRQFDHLNDEQWTSLLCGVVPASAAEHLKVCPACAEEARRVVAAIGSFAQQSRLWAERHAAARPIQAYGRRSAASWPAMAQGAAACAAAALVLAFGVGILHKSGQPLAVRQPIAAVRAAPQVTPATLKADNQLLSAIDGELSEDDASSAGNYGLTAGRHTVTRRPAKGISN
jgi:hypothetical protein